MHSRLEELARTVNALHEAVDRSALHIPVHVRTVDASYRLLGAWVAQHATPAPLPVLEIYLVSYDQTADPDRFRTEIRCPVRETSPS